MPSREKEEAAKRSNNLMHLSFLFFWMFFSLHSFFVSNHSFPNQTLSLFVASWVRFAHSLAHSSHEYKRVEVKWIHSNGLNYTVCVHRKQQQHVLETECKKNFTKTCSLVEIEQWVSVWTYTDEYRELAERKSEKTKENFNVKSKNQAKDGNIENSKQTIYVFFVPLPTKFIYI